MRDGEKGALRDFLIIGGLLALVLVGGLYGLNRYNAEQAENGNSEQASNDEAERNDQQTDQQAERERQQAEDRERTERESAEAAQRQEDQRKAAAEREQAEQEKEVAAAGSDDSDNDLPQTGPADTFMAIIAVSALAFAGLHYVRSRNA